MEAKRIVSLTPASTEMLFALGLDDEIVGVSSYCNWPIAAKSKEKVGSFSNPNIEKIIMLEPDLVILTGMEQAHFKGILSKLKIDYLIVDPKNIEELLTSIDEIAAITDRKREARDIRKGIEETLKRIGRKVAHSSRKKRPKVYLEIWHDPIMSPGGNSFVSDMIEKAGGANITADLRRAFSKIDPERIIYRNPDIIILTYMKSQKWIRENLAKRVGWSSIGAVKNNKVFTDINPDIMLRPSPRVKEGLIELYERFYER
ncbi:MAG: cobalamin-binding protein [Candidatus Omnitrophica bacterium]|nr:cobalamin-binding protein [Candidatus Omnitrophota bacterium]